MSIGLVGIKTGMTRVFDESGISIPVTVINIDTNRVSQIKTVDRDGYSAVQIAYGCLLYTSPSPRDLMRSRMPSSA